jgi:DNA-binding Lrp family transcriptional regulator
MKSIEYDQLNERIIQLLYDNPELTNAEIGNIVKLSQPAIHARVDYLTKNEYLITRIGYNANKTHNQVYLMVFLKTKGSFSLFETHICPFIAQSYHLTGHWNYLLIICGDSYEQLNLFFNQCIHAHEEVIDCEVQTITSTLIPEILRPRIDQHCSLIQPLKETMACPLFHHSKIN